MGYRFQSVIAGLLWVILSSSAAAQLFDENEVFKSYLVTPQEAPVVDGIIEPFEWDAAGPPIVVNSETRPGQLGGDTLEPYGGDEDLSFQFRSMWVAPWDIYFLVEVTDDVAMDDDHNLPDRPWERDQIELFIDGDQLQGGNIRWWNGGEDPPLDEQFSAIETYGKFGVARTNEFEGNTGIMSVDPEDVGLNGISGSGIATETGENANYFVEYRISMFDAFENGLFEGTDAGSFGTMIPDLTAIKFQVAMSDNDNAGDANGVRSHGGVPFASVVTEGPNEWWRSDTYPNLLLSSEYVPDTGLDCDFDDNGTCDIGDLDALTLEVATAPANPNLDFDLNQDGAVGSDDQDQWLQLAGEANGFAGSYFRGDANLDGRVDAGDLNVIALNWNTENNLWSEGNLVGAGVGASDLNALALTWQQVTPTVAEQAAVPEPASFVLALLAMVFLGCGRFRK